MSVLDETTLLYILETKLDLDILPLFFSFFMQLWDFFF